MLTLVANHGQGPSHTELIRHDKNTFVCCFFGVCYPVKESKYYSGLGWISGTLRKTRWQWQRERHQTKGLMSRTMAVHVRYNSWYTLPSSAKQREMTSG